MVLLVLFSSACTWHEVERTLWPEVHDDYFQVTEEWTRTDAIYSGLDTELKVRATLTSWPWREAYVQRRAAMYRLTSREQADLLDEQRRAAESGIDILIATSSSFPENRKIEYAGDLWKVFLLDGQGRKIFPLEIRDASWNTQQLRRFIPHYTQWQKFLWVRFPVQTEDTLHMVITGPLGQLVFEWNESV
ncbi:MAG: hypothetical protein EOM25_01535 [Deltaproteobacteria bacterium]|nr:hypothetical protein [Deltaproteobacteria bacterium]